MAATYILKVVWNLANYISMICIFFFFGKH